MEYPKTLEEFKHQFAAEAACVQYLYALRWPNGFTCARYGTLVQSVLIVFCGMK